MRIEFEGTNVVLLPNPIQGQMDVDDIEIGRITDRISCASIRDAILEVASIGQGLKDEKLALESSLKEIELEFSLEVGTSGNLIFVKGDIKGHIRVKLVWK